MANIRAEWVKVPNGELQIDAYLSEPITEEIVPEIIIIQESCSNSFKLQPGYIP